MFIAIGICVAVIWALIKAAKLGYPQPLEILAAAVALEIAGKAVVRPLASWVFSGKRRGRCAL